jgi:hypothetical protein
VHADHEQFDRDHVRSADHIEHADEQLFRDTPVG